MKKIKEYKLFRNEDKHPYLKTVREFDYDTDFYDDVSEVARLMVDLYSVNELFVEYIYALGFNCSHELLGIVELSHETDMQSKIPIKELFMTLLLMGANEFILIHNHPNNTLYPSDADINTTSKIKLGANLLELNFRDHLIICDEDFISIKD